MRGTRPEAGRSEEGDGLGSAAVGSMVACAVHGHTCYTDVSVMNFPVSIAVCIGCDTPRSEADKTRQSPPPPPPFIGIYSAWNRSNCPFRPTKIPSQCFDPLYFLFFYLL